MKQFDSVFIKTVRTAVLWRSGVPETVLRFLPFKKKYQKLLDKYNCNEYYYSINCN